MCIAREAVAPPASCETTRTPLGSVVTLTGAVTGLPASAGRLQRGVGERKGGRGEGHALIMSASSPARSSAVRHAAPAGAGRGAATHPGKSSLKTFCVATSPMSLSRSVACGGTRATMREADAGGGGGLWAAPAGGGGGGGGGGKRWAARAGEGARACARAWQKIFRGGRADGS